MRYKFVQTFLSLCCILVLFTACQTTRGKYNTLYSVATAADAAMITWGDYVKKGKATEEQEIKVYTAYTKYQSLMLKAMRYVRYDIKEPAPNDVAEAFDEFITIVANLTTVK